jgi:GT2 family glycosyltransferase
VSPPSELTSTQAALEPLPHALAPLKRTRPAGDTHPVERPRTSIVILTHNELDYTRRCLESIAAHTAEPYELVLVDNGSTDGTVAYLREQPGATVIENGANLGFGAGCNQGIAAARGDRILLLNNDTIATPGWLDAMHAALDAEPGRGIVGPRSNHVAGRQLVEDVPYDVWTLDGLGEFAEAWTGQHAGEGRQLARLIGFCLLVRREVFERIGGFDLRFGIGNFEDDDLCLRAGVAGFTCWMCDDAYVHHFGSRTFEGQSVPYAHRLEEAWDLFVAKWNPATITDDAGAILGYEATNLVSGVRFDPRTHFAPLVAAQDTGEVVRFDQRRSSLLVLADHLHPGHTRNLLTSVCAAVTAADDVTVVVRIDPIDTTTIDALEAIADDRAAALPDIVVVGASNHNDEPVVRACDLVVTTPETELAVGGMARWCGTATCRTEDLPAVLARQSAA